MKILVVSPHTDDAELGSGGSISKFIEEDHEIFWIVFSTCDVSLPAGYPRDILRREFLQVLHSIGLIEEMCNIFEFRVRHLFEHRQDILEELIQIRNEFKPDLVIAPSLNDLHQDHQTVANEVVRAFKTTSSIICYELPWNHMNFNTQLFVKLNESHISMKWKILRNYQSQIQQNRTYFSEEFIRGLAKVRGIQCNAEYAEAFEVVRWIL